MVYGDEECFTRLNFKRNVPLNNKQNQISLGSQKSKKTLFSKGRTVGGT